MKINKQQLIKILDTLEVKKIGKTKEGYVYEIKQIVFEDELQQIKNIKEKLLHDEIKKHTQQEDKK